MHDTGHRAVSSMIEARIKSKKRREPARRFSNEYVEERVLRAFLDTFMRYGVDDYDVDKERRKIRGWIETAHDKFDVDDDDDETSLIQQCAAWFRDKWRGLHGLYQIGYQAMMAYEDGRYVKLEERPFLSTMHCCGHPWIERQDERQWAQIFRTCLLVTPLFPGAPPGQHKVCLLNGTMDMDTGELSEHSREDRLVSRLSFDYDPDARCPVYEKFLLDTFRSDLGDEERDRSIDCFEEFTALTMFECHDYHRFLVLQGTTRTGKGTLLNVIKMMHDRVSAVPLDGLDNEQNLASMMGCLVNIQGETDEKTYIADAQVKSIVAGEHVTVKTVYHPPHPVVLSARLVISTNSPLMTRDTSGAVLARMIQLNCDNHVPEKLRDVTLSDRIRTEAPGIFNRMVKAWRRLRARGRFEMPPSITQTVDEFEYNNNPVMRWLLDQTHQGAAYLSSDYVLPKNLAELTPTNQLYLNYRQWSQDSGLMPMNDVTFSMKLSHVRLKDVDVGPYNGRVGNRVLKCRKLNLIANPRY